MSITVVSLSAIRSKKILNKYKRIVKNIQPQNLNVKYFDKSEVLDLVTDIFDEQELNKLKQVCPVHLVRNIEPHNDSGFLDGSMLSHHVYFLVIESKLKDIGHYDAPTDNFMFCGKKSIELHENTLYKFDAKKMHAVMVDKLVTGFTFWSNK